MLQLSPGALVQHTAWPVTHGVALPALPPPPSWGFVFSCGMCQLNLGLRPFAGSDDLFYTLSKQKTSVLSILHVEIITENIGQLISLLAFTSQGSLRMLDSTEDIH